MSVHPSSPAPTRASSRLAWVDAAKGLSILLVVAHHTVEALQTSGLAPAALVTANTALAAMRMPLFFLASGLFVAGPLGASWRTLLHKRVALFLYLYAIWVLLRFAYFQISAVAAADPGDATDFVELVWSPLLPGSGMWFLYALALFAVIGKLLVGVPPWLQLAASGALSAFVGAEILQFEGEAWTRMARYLFFFLLGWHARHLVEQLARSSTLLRMVLAAAGCVACAAVAIGLDIRSVPGPALALNVLALTFGILFAAWISRYRVGRPLVVLGGRTLPVYLVHVFWLAAVMIGVQHLDLPRAAGFVLAPVLAVLLTVLSLLTQQALVRAGAPWLFALPRRWAYRPR
ncbi:MAG: acyltransferase family protein [Pseudonocardia sp.]